MDSALSLSEDTSNVQELDSRAVFGDLYREYYPDLWRNALVLCKDQEMAQDLLQEAIRKAYENFHAFEVGTNFGAWVCVIMRNTFLNSLRLRKIESPQDPMVLAATNEDLSATTAFDQFRQAGFVEDARDALLQVPDSLRIPVLYADFREYTYKQIAEVLGCPIGTVMSRIHRGRAYLRHLLNSEDY